MEIKVIQTSGPLKSLKCLCNKFSKKENFKINPVILAGITKFDLGIWDLGFGKGFGTRMGMGFGIWDLEFGIWGGMGWDMGGKYVLACFTRVLQSTLHPSLRTS